MAGSSNTQICLMCETELNITKGFYKSNSILFSKNQEQRMCWCKSCVSDIFKLNKEMYEDDEKALYETCRQVDTYFDKKLCERAVIKAEEKGSDLCSVYFTQVNSLPQYKNRTFMKDNRSAEMGYEQKGEVEYSEEDLKSQKDVIRLLGYDPFEDYGKYDKKYLYNEVVLYLDEDTLEDPYKLSVVIQIVKNNNQIRLTDLAVNKLSSTTKSLIENNKEIKELTAVKTQLNTVNDKLSKENNIALKHRGGSSSKNSTLGSMMKNLRELGFDKAEQDYYDMCKSYGIKQSADISNKSIMEILKFDDNDFNIMFKQQRSEIQKLQDVEMNLREEIRKLVIENNDLKNK